MHGGVALTHALNPRPDSSLGTGNAFVTLKAFIHQLLVKPFGPVLNGFRADEEAQRCLGYIRFTQGRSY